MNFLLFIFVLYFKQSSAIKTTVELINLVTRHGIRTPVNLYPANPYNATFWTKYGGLGLLTQAGMNQHYELGRFLRIRYKGIITQPYDLSKLYVRSTDYPRTLSSAYSLLAGLYPPAPNQVFNKNFPNWQPIPVFSNDRSYEPILRYTGGNLCSKYTRLKAESQNTSKYFQIQNDNMDFIKLMRNLSGISDLGLYAMWKIADNYMVESALNLPISQWVLDNKQKILELNDYNFLFDYDTTEMAQLVSGPLLGDIANNIKNKMNNLSTRELHFYSSHDTFIAALHKLLGLSNPIVQPQFASALIFELRKEVNTTNYFVRVLYKNNRENEPISLKELKITGCSSLCPVDDFLKLASDLAVTDYEKACENPKKC